MGEHEKTDVTEAAVSGGDDDSASDAGDGNGALGSQPGADPEDAEEIEKERQERLDPDNRPEHAEVDNSDRDFDPEKGMYTDTEGYEQAEARFPPMGEQGA